MGYRAELKGSRCIRVGVFPPVVFEVPKGIDVTVEKNTTSWVTGVDARLWARWRQHAAACASPTLTSRRGALHRRSAEEEGVGTRPAPNRNRKRRSFRSDRHEMPRRAVKTQKATTDESGSNTESAKRRGHARAPAVTVSAVVSHNTKCG